MRMVVVVLALLATMVSARAGDLVEPRMHLARGGPETPQIALTLDACSGGVDMRILDALIANRVPATLFLTGKWLSANPEAVALIKQHPDLFQFENHGAEHVPAVIGSEKPYGIAPAGTAEAVMAEVEGGAFFIESLFGRKPAWYRDATALYSPAAIDMIEQAGFRIAGFSLNGDAGASFSAEAAAESIAGAQDGDVIIAHMNQPTRAAGDGVVAGILALKAKGFRFVRLDQVEVVGE
ncbi:MAG: polysaccharide deacetylase family protein [Alphaproteobacteria bacterium]|nr:polysaccharide deacetylase family protein [Alphaproteobacteria bacterium]